MDSDYKLKHESFMSNLTGSSPLEVLCSTLYSPATVLLNIAFASSLHLPQLHNVWLSFLCMTVPIILSVTILASHSGLLLILMTSTAIIVRIQSSKENRNRNIPKHINSDAIFTFFKGSLLCGTCIAILAVDFPAFPRRFAKTEQFGYSLMDTGVGLFTFSSALQSKTMRMRQFQWSRELRSNLPLLLLGIARVMAVKLFNYAEHVAEYGVYWNFFLTLSVVRFAGKLACAICQYQIGRLGVLCAALVIGHQFLLTFAGLESLLLYGRRGDGQRDLHDYLDLNREGILSLPGYIALYLAGLLVNHVATLPDLFKSSFRHLLFASCILSFAGCFFFDHFCAINVSRVQCNLPYFLWTCSVGLAMLFGFYEIWINFLQNSHERNSDFDKLLPYVGFIARNGLVYFLVANLLTGLVNLCIKTIFVEDYGAVAILMLYSLALWGLVWVIELVSKILK